MKKGIAYLLALAVLAAMLAGCGNAESSQEGEFKAGENGVVKVYNWGDYIDEEVIDLFEKETGIEVVYDLFENNEEMYPIIEAGGRVYDAVCPSDYMIERMIRNGLLQPGIGFKGRMKQASRKGGEIVPISIYISFLHRRIVLIQQDNHLFSVISAKEIRQLIQRKRGILLAHGRGHTLKVSLLGV